MRRTLKVAGVTTLALGVAAAIAVPLLLREPGTSASVRQRVTGASATTTPASASPPSTVVSPPTIAERRRIDEPVAKALVRTYARSVDALESDSAVSNLAQVVTGKALQEVQAQVLELKSNGWTITGSPRIDHVRVIKSDRSSATATVQACVDSSSVRTVDAAGKTVLLNPHASRRALNLYDLAYSDGAWRVVSHGFPNDTSC